MVHFPVTSRPSGAGPAAGSSRRSANEGHGPPGGDPSSDALVGPPGRRTGAPGARTARRVTGEDAFGHRATQVSGASRGQSIRTVAELWCRRLPLRPDPARAGGGAVAGAGGGRHRFPQGRPLSARGGPPVLQHPGRGRQLPDRRQCPRRVRHRLVPAARTAVPGRRQGRSRRPSAGLPDIRDGTSPAPAAACPERARRARRHRSAACGPGRGHRSTVPTPPSVAAGNIRVTPTTVMTACRAPAATPYPGAAP